MAPAHGILVRVYAPFERVVDALRPERSYSNVYIEVFKTRPRVAVAVGSKRLSRTGNPLVLTMIIVEEERTTLVKAIATASDRGLFHLLETSSPRDYALESVNSVCEVLRAHCELLGEVDNLDASRSELLGVL